MHKTTWLAALSMILVLGVSRVDAQIINWTDRAFANVNGGYQTGSHDFETTKTFALYGETATVKTGHEIGNGGLLDISGGVRIWSNVGAGIGYSRFQDSNDITIQASLPHPLFFDQPRSVSVPAPGLEHSESVVHLFGLWVLPVGAKVDVAFFGGPSIFSVKQDLVTDIQVLRPETAPFPGTVTGIARDTAKKTTAGVNLGADFSYMVTPQLGGGVFVRYSSASAELSAGGLTVKTDVGGFQIGGGLRVRIR
jgi:hypothetical protein